MARIPTKKVVREGVKKKPAKGISQTLSEGSSVSVPLKGIKKNTRARVPVLISKKQALPSEKVSVPTRARSVIKLTSAHRSTKTSVSISDNTSKPQQRTPQQIQEPEKNIKKVVTVHQSKVPSTLSPFRFPMLSPQLLSNVARVVGVFFVAAGGILSLLNLSNFDVAQQASLSGTVMSTTSTSSIGTTSVNERPEARISIINASTFINSVPISINVPIATNIAVIAIRKVDHKEFFLGNATNIDPTTWQYIWETESFTDGEYLIKLVIKNVYGSYENINNVEYLLQNHFEIPNSTATSTITTASTSQGVQSVATSTSSVPIKVFFDILEKSPLKGGVSFVVEVEESTEVKIYARNTKTYAVHYIGLATKENNIKWNFEWDSKTIADGNYAFQAKVLVNGVTAESPYETAIVDNIIEPKIVEPVVASVASTSTDSNISPALNELKPSITLSISESNPISGFVDVRIKTSSASWVELYAVSKSSLTSRFLGLAQSKSDTDWVYTWDTKNSPNGEYSIYARVKNIYGFTEGSRTSVTILNEVLAIFTKEQEKSIDTLHAIETDLIKQASEPVELRSTTTATYPAPNVVYVKPVSKFIETVSVEDSLKDNIKNLLDDFRASLDSKLGEFAVAIRKGDVEHSEQIKAEIEKLKNEVLKKFPNEEGVLLKTEVDAYLTQMISELSDITSKNETLIKERLGEALVKDSDKDDVSDYDELNLYHTNPFAADTDGDGYIDSVEIQLGYNPHDSRSEALVVYESPKESGIVREDLFVVEAITTLTDEAISSEVVVPKKALISGKGLPNSFVTLYIYSTPIVVTVKTDNNGGWSYIFDKELEEGSHEVYVGITDNAGRIVAKSSPLPFVKTAEAFTNSNTPIETNSVRGPLLLEENSMLLVGAIAVTALGLVLILLGLYAVHKEEDTLVSQST